MKRSGMRALANFVENTSAGGVFVFSVRLWADTKTMTARSPKRPAGEPN